MTFTSFQHWSRCTFPPGLLRFPQTLSSLSLTLTAAGRFDPQTLFIFCSSTQMPFLLIISLIPKGKPFLSTQPELTTSPLLFYTLFTTPEVFCLCIVWRTVGARPVCCSHIVILFANLSTKYVPFCFKQKQ